jgi:hypothetical protein
VQDGCVLTTSAQPVSERPLFGVAARALRGRSTARSSCTCRPVPFPVGHGLPEQLQRQRSLPARVPLPPTLGRRTASYALLTSRMGGPFNRVQGDNAPPISRSRALRGMMMHQPPETHRHRRDGGRTAHTGPPTPPVSDALWAKLGPLSRRADRPARVGRRRIEQRCVVEAILYRLAANQA